MTTSFWIALALLVLFVAAIGLGYLLAEASRRIDEMVSLALDRDDDGLSDTLPDLYHEDEMWDRIAPYHPDWMKDTK